MKRSATWISALALAAAGGCGGGEEEAKAPIPMGQVPAAVLKAAQNKMKDVAFDSAFTEKVKGANAYELKGKDKTGKEREIEVSRDGKILGSN